MKPVKIINERDFIFYTHNAVPKELSIHFVSASAFGKLRRKKGATYRKFGANEWVSFKFGDFEITFHKKPL